jgi:hypothetical protein
MPYFSNKTSDAGVDTFARQGGRLFAQALESLYGLVADLEVDEFLDGSRRLDGVARLLDGSLAAYEDAYRAASTDLSNLTDSPVFGEPEYARLVDAAGTMGIALDEASDRDMYAVTLHAVAALRGLVLDASQRRVADFASIDGIVRAAIRAQEVSLAVTGTLSGAYRGDYA